MTPSQFLTPLRASLFELYLMALKEQSYFNWEALLIGEFDKKEGNVTFIKTNAVSKSDKLKVAYEYLSSQETKPDFIIRLDDDDVISPDVLKKAALMDFDCFADEYHSYYDITTSTISQQTRHWLANTVIHKYEHGIAPYGENHIPLFMHDHSQAWHVYYANKKIVWASKKNPIYLRVISPTTITSKMDAAKAAKIESFDQAAYEKYLKTFGKWNAFNCNDFEKYKPKLIQIWEHFSKMKIQVKKKSFFNIFR